MRELAAGVYNLMKGTRQHAMPVGEFMDRVSNSDQDVEANLSTVLQSVRGTPAIIILLQHRRHFTSMLLT